MNTLTRNKFLSALLISFTFLTMLSASPVSAAEPDNIRIVSDTNNVRSGQSVPALKRSASLDVVAQNWAAKMSSTKDFKHNPNVGNEIPSGWSTWGENIAYGYSSADVTAAWVKSPGHYANLIRPTFTHIGVGYYTGSDNRPYAVQVFAGYSGSPDTVSGKDILSAGSQLASGESLTDTTNQYRFIMQTDGNAVLYDPNGKALWSTQTFVPGSRFTLQTDGNAIVYTPDNKPVFSTNTFGNGSYLRLQGDGNFVLYRSNGQPVWHTFALGGKPQPKDTLLGGQTLAAGQKIVSSNNEYQAVMQTDGNFVVYGANNKVMWSSQTFVAGSRFTLQTDGNAVVYTPDNKPAFVTGAVGAGAKIVMQSDGNLVLYRANNTAAFNSFAGK